MWLLAAEAESHTCAAWPLCSAAQAYASDTSADPQTTGVMVVAARALSRMGSSVAAAIVTGTRTGMTTRVLAVPMGWTAPWSCPTTVARSFAAHTTTSAQRHAP